MNFSFYLAADTRRQLPTIFRPGDSARPKPAICLCYKETGKLELVEGNTFSEI